MKEASSVVAVGEEGVSTLSTLGFIWMRRAWIFLNLATPSSFWLVSGGARSDDEDGGDIGGEVDEGDGKSGVGESEIGESDSLILLEGGG